MIETLTPSPLEALAASFGYKFHRPELIELAFTHKSYANELMNGSSTTGDDNERLEFLGDAVLDLALSDVLMKRFPLDTEGALSKKRASLVNEDSLCGIAKARGFDQYLRLGKGEIKTGGLQKSRILASSLEAVIGAIFQDSGYILVNNVIETLFAESLERLTTETIDFSADFKTRLQERAQEVRKSTPTYRLESESGPDHDKSFIVGVELDGESLATGTGKSKKAAEQDAAKKALETLCPKI
jgi:ribonuclease-3